MKPSDENIEAAKEFIRLRIATVRKATDEIEKLLTEAAGRIVDISFKYSIDPKQFVFSANHNLNAEVAAVISQLIDDIMTLIEYAVTAFAETDKETGEITVYASSLGDGDTVSQLATQYAVKFRNELEAIIAAGMYYSLSSTQILSQIKTNLATPYAPEIMQKAFKEQGFEAQNIRNAGKSQGAGRYKSSFNTIIRLVTGTIGLVWWWWQGEKMRRDGAAYFMQMRGSSYDCPVCDSETGIHPIEEIDSDYPHLNCYCYRVPIYETDI